MRSAGAKTPIGVEQIALRARSELVVQKLEDLETREKAAFLVVAVRRASGQTIHRPGLDTVLEADDILVVMGHEGVAPEFTRRHLVKRQFQ